MPMPKSARRKYTVFQLQLFSLEVQAKRRFPRDLASLLTTFPSVPVLTLATTLLPPGASTLSSPAKDSPLLAESLTPTAGPLSYAADELLQCRLCSVFFRSVDVLSVIPIARRNVLAANADSARPGGTLAATVGEDVVRGERDASVLAVL